VPHIGILAITQQCGQQLLARIAMAAALDETNTTPQYTAIPYRGTPLIFI
jgi:hypothetical protein